MKSALRLVCIAAVAIWTLAACGGGDAGTALESPEDSNVQTLTRAEAAQRLSALQAQGVTCTESYGVCKVARCEYPVDDVQQVKQTCCDSIGNCTVTTWRICGCIAP